MGENCQKPGRSVTNTGNSRTPKTQVKPCNGCGLGVFQGRLNTSLQFLHLAFLALLLRRS
ncbi:hypothetical protein BRM22_23850 [Xanthomonas oryzae pv. oryzae]|nr:hypothetical protein BCR61_01075 [Xanthomonas oryzae pv. oryzae]AXQ73718.1 hypothetical protein BXU03_01055 [Xanthomonas oryzae pv. oryzae]RBA51050.1 hypothetical protein BRO16_19955 [Xanthomonas oryzae pv. oryzae]RBA66943.1 hypothetical protein BRO09_20375 [Xanthomonas oryzae pv. oryzae]RBA74276.1 hypothetical protein BRN68_04910 [Xanthomonas oryzae pv. oryzae]